MSDAIPTELPPYVDLAAAVVQAYVGANSLPASELPALIRSTHAGLVQLAAGAMASAAPAEPLIPAVPVKKSITPDHIICLEDGRALKSLKRHLRARYDMSPEQYRAKWGLPADYPMVALNYAAQRSALAKSFGLGQQRAPLAA